MKKKILFTTMSKKKFRKTCKGCGNKYRTATWGNDMCLQCRPQKNEQEKPQSKKENGAQADVADND